MKLIYLKIFLCFALFFVLLEKAYSWTEMTHEQHLTPIALELIKLDDENSAKNCKKGIKEECNRRYSTEIFMKNKILTLYGAHDEDFPCSEIELPVHNLKFFGITIPKEDFFKYGLMLHCRANNHYGHPLSRFGLTDSPWVGLDDPDVHPLIWAKFNAEFNAKQEFGEGRYWKGFKQLKRLDKLTAADIDHGNMSWVKAVDRYGYTESSKRLAYYTLGFVLHVLQDQGVPEHVHDDPHGASGYTGFENWTWELWMKDKQKWKYEKDEIKHWWDLKTKDKETWVFQIIDEAKNLTIPKYRKIDDFFIDLAKIGYSMNRFKGGKLNKPPKDPIDLKSDLARMFKVKYDPLNYRSINDPTDMMYLPLVTLDQWILENHPPGPLIKKGDIVKWCPQRYNSNPLSAKGHDIGEWWPTHVEIPVKKPGVENDVEGFYYIELSGDFPTNKKYIEPQRNYYPKAFLPTPLPDVKKLFPDKWESWRIDKLDGKTNLYTPIAKTVIPYVVKYCAGLIEHYYDIVNHPPYVKEVRVYNSDGIPMYSGRWVDNEKKVPGKNRRWVKNRNLSREIDEFVNPGTIRIDIYFSEPVTVESVKLGKQPIASRSGGFENLTIWSGFHKVTLEKESDEETIFIKARDNNNHYQDIGGELDINPSTPARRRTVVARTDNGEEPIRYKWINYDKNDARNSNHIDINHRIKIDRGKLKSIVVNATPDQINPCGQVTFEAREGIYEFEDGETKTLPLSHKDIERITWNLEGHMTVINKRKLIWQNQPEKMLVGTASIVRADWPESDVEGIAIAGHVKGEAVANIRAISETSSFFKVEDVSTDVKVEVGESFQNHAVKFYCKGINNPDYKTTTDVWWESDSPEILECSSSGRCVGRSAGIANVSLFYKEKGRKGAFITSRPVEVYKEQIDCKPLRDAYTKKFNSMIEHYKKRSCEIANYATGCKQNVAGYLGAYVQGVFLDVLCDQQNYIECGKRFVDEYYECLKNCNEQWQQQIKTQSELTACQRKCNEKAGKRKKACKEMRKEEGDFIASSEGLGEQKDEDKEKNGYVTEDETPTIPNFQGIWCANNKRWRIEVKQKDHTAEVTLIDRWDKSYQGSCVDAKIVMKHSFEINKKKLPPVLTGELDWESHNKGKHTEKLLPWFFLLWEVPLKNRVDIIGVHSPGIYTNDNSLKTQDLKSKVRNTWRGFRGVREGTQDITCPK